MQLQSEKRRLLALVVSSLCLTLLFTVIGLTVGAGLTLIAAAQAETLEPTQRPTSEFDFNIQPTRPPFGTETPPPSLTGVNGRAVNGPVAVRSGPGLNFPRIGAVPLNGRVDIIGYNGYNLDRPCSANFAADLDMWVMVLYRGQPGWMARCALQITGEFNLSRMIVNAPPPGAPLPTGFATPAAP